MQQYPTPVPPPVLGEDGRVDRKPMKGEELAEAIRRGEACNWQDLDVSGEVDLTGVMVEKPLVIRRSLFTGPVNLSQARLERGADFEGCHFRRLSLVDARIEGSLILENAAIGAGEAEMPDLKAIHRIVAALAAGRWRVRSSRSDEKDARLKKIRIRLRRRASRRRWEEKHRKTRAAYPEAHVAADFTNLRVEGCLNLMNADVFGDLFCTHANVEDDFRIDGAIVHGDLRLRRSHLGELCSDARSRIAREGSAPGEPRPCRIRGRLDLSSARIDGDLRLIGVDVGGELSLQTAEVKGNFLCRPGEHVRAGRKLHVRSRIQDGAWLLGARIGGTVELGGTRIRGDLSLNTAQIGGRLECSHSGRWHLTALGGLDLTNCRIAASANFLRCSARGDVNLVDTHTGSDVFFTGARVGGELSLQNASVGGNLLCTVLESGERKIPCRIAGRAWFLGAVVTGNVDISGAWIGSDLILQNAKIGNNLHAEVMAGARTQIVGSAFLDNASTGANVFLIGAHLGGDLSLQNASVGGTFFCTATSGPRDNLPCQISGKAWLLGAVVAGDVDISGAWIGDNLIMQNVKIGQNLQAKIMGGFRTQIDGAAFLNGARIAGGAELAGSDLRQSLILDNALVEGDLQVVFGFVDRPGWGIVRARVGTGLRADSATIGKRVVLMGLDVGPEDAGAKTTHDVDFSGAKVNGAFSLYSPDVARNSIRAAKAGYLASGIDAEREEELLAQARRERTTIRGDLRLTRAEVLGGVELDGSTIEGQWQMQDANVRANVTCRPVELPPPLLPGRASVSRADLETLELAGDLDLTGLTIRGDLILRDTRIRGRLELYPWGTPPAGVGEDRIAIIEGALRLDAAQVSHLVVSGRSFGDRAEPKPPWWKRAVENVRTAWSQGDYLLILFLLRGGNPEQYGSFKDRKLDIVLERATIGRLEIAEPLPGKVDLGNLVVGSWEEHDRANFYRDMLRLSYPFKRSSYLAIENDLRNKGRDEEADKVHVWMRQRDRENTARFGSALWDRLLDLTTKYGTTSARLFWVMLLLFATSLWLFRDPSRVEYDLAPSADKKPPITHLSPEPEEWTWGDVVFFAVRHHVPIVSLGIDEEVQPRGTWLKGYAVAVVAASWIMWPLFIASLSGFLRKRS